MLDNFVQSWRGHPLRFGLDCEPSVMVLRRAILLAKHRALRERLQIPVAALAKVAANVSLRMQKSRSDPANSTFSL